MLEPEETVNSKNNTTFSGERDLKRTEKYNLNNEVNVGCDNISKVFVVVYKNVLIFNIKRRV